MSLVTAAKSSFEPLPAGSYSAVCVSMIDVGTMTGPFGSQQKLWIEWECDELDSSGNRYRVGKFYTNSISAKSKLREHLESWRGKQFTRDELSGFSLLTILGKPCMLAVSNTTKDDKTYSNVDAVSKLAKGMQAIEPSEPTLAFDVDDPDQDVLDRLPEFIRKIIEKAPEYNGRSQPVKAVPAPSAPTDDVPW